MIELSLENASKAMVVGKNTGKCPACGQKVETFQSLVSPRTEGVWFFCDQCVLPDLLMSLIPTQRDRKTESGGR